MHRSPVCLAAAASFAGRGKQPGKRIPPSLSLPFPTIPPCNCKPKKVYKADSAHRCLQFSLPFSQFTLMSATHHALAYHPSTPHTTHALRKTTTAATTSSRVPRPASKNLGRSKLLPKETKAKSVPAPEEDDSMGSSFLQFWYVLSVRFTTIYHKKPPPPSSPIANIESNSAMCEKQIVVPNNSILYCSEKYGHSFSSWFRGVNTS